ncbi:flavin reductase family protein [Blastomonas fulva]|jgi:3-hydroxy-9,10-secoandrosta-1,3,5(10)-triene-9,17-dione monooxygenase reductase component|uniref:flavin reductase family protein n=1 Tax=Blastomonas fulva TaxID=1550728 RepID=UPI003D2C5592
MEQQAQTIADSPPPIAEPPINPAQAFREVMGCLPTAVALVTGLDDGDNPVGIVVGSLTSISLEPALVGFFIGTGSNTWPQIERSGRFAASVVASSMAQGLAHFVANRDDRFAQIPLDTSPGGLPIPREAAAWIECAVEGTHRIGDHDLIVGRPLALAGRADSIPLVFHSRQFKIVSAAG